MGFDVTYHPVSTEELTSWCIERLPEIRTKNFEGALRVSQEMRLSEEDTRKYLNLLDQVASFKEDAPFGSNLGFGCAAIQGMFRTFFYTRNSSLTNFFRNNNLSTQYLCSIEEDLGLTTQASPGFIQENYCAGVWLSAASVKALLALLGEDPVAKQAFEENFPNGQAEVVLDALRLAEAYDLGLLEATDVVEPNPLDLNTSKACTKLENCDAAGALLYRDMALQQLRDAGVL